MSAGVSERILFEGDRRRRVVAEDKEIYSNKSPVS